VDEQGGEGLGTVTVIVNAPPVAGDDVASVDEDSSVAVPVLANDTDPENGTLQLTITTPPEHGTAEVNPDQTVAYTPVATCTADAASCSTVALQFSLAANAAVKRSGNHTLVVRWKFESI
jgi:hypothetical protein